MGLEADRQARFLERLAMTSNVSAAVRHAGWTKTAVYRLKQSDAVFRAAWLEALAIGYEELEMEMLQRARFGIIKTTGPKSDKPARITEYSDAQALRLLLAHKQEVEETKSAHASNDQQSAKIRLRERLEALRERSASEA